MSAFGTQTQQCHTTIGVDFGKGCVELTSIHFGLLADRFTHELVPDVALKLGRALIYHALASCCADRDAVSEQMAKLDEALR